jgi:hypothetical protein
VWVEPSSTWSAPLRCAVGATLLIVTDCVSVLPAAPSESVAWTETVEPAGPSGKVQSNEPPLFVLEAFDFVPLLPQLVATDWTVSTPGSEIEYA